jgi:hypothetical protein
LIETYKHLDPLAGGCCNSSDVLIDLQTIFSSLPLANASSSQTSGTPDCPPGYIALGNDLNKDAGGTYSYICVLRALSFTPGTAFLANVTVAIGTDADPPACPDSWIQIPGNLKEGTASSDVMNLCVFTSTTATNIILDLQIAQGNSYPAACPPGYVVATPNLSGGVGFGGENICALYGALDSAIKRLNASPAFLPRHLPAIQGWSTRTPEPPADKSPLVSFPPSEHRVSH